LIVVLDSLWIDYLGVEKFCCLKEVVESRRDKGVDFIFEKSRRDVERNFSKKMTEKKFTS